jgi:hypothetical protein
VSTLRLANRCVYAHELELYSHADLLGEMRRLRTRYSAGHAAVINPRVAGSHGDLVQGLALATYAHRRSVIGGEAEPFWQAAMLDRLVGPVAPNANVDDDGLLASTPLGPTRYQEHH